MNNIFDEKTHKLLRQAQLIIFALSCAMSTLTAAIDLGRVGAIVCAVITAIGVFVTTLVENDSKEYFSTKTIVTKILPDKKPEE